MPVFIALANPAAADESAQSDSVVAAYPTNPVIVGVDGGPANASNAFGTMTWLNRSVTLVGTHRAVGLCHRVYLTTYDIYANQLGVTSTSLLCPPNEVPMTMSTKADIRGGAAQAVVCIRDRNFRELACEGYFRP